MAKNYIDCFKQSLDKLEGVPDSRKSNIADKMVQLERAGKVHTIADALGELKKDADYKKFITVKEARIDIKFIKELTGLTGDMNDKDFTGFMVDRLVGTAKHGQGFGLSVNAVQNAAEKQYMRMIEGQLYRAMRENLDNEYGVINHKELMSLFEDRKSTLGIQFQNRVLDELVRLDVYTKKPTKSQYNDKFATRVAEVLLEVKKHAIAKNESVGITIDKLDHHAFKQTYDNDVLIKKINKHRNRLKTFNPWDETWDESIKVAKREFAQENYDHVDWDAVEFKMEQVLTNDKRLELLENTFEKSIKGDNNRWFEGNVNTATIDKSKRVILFKNDHRFAVHSTVGTGNVYASVSSDLIRMSHQYAAAAKMGINIEDNLGFIVKGRNLTDSQKRKITNALKQVTGESRETGNIRAARISSALRTYASSSIAGGFTKYAVVIDPILTRKTLQQHGMSTGKITTQFKALNKMFSDKDELRAFMQTMDMTYKTHIGQTINRHNMSLDTDTSNITRTIRDKTHYYTGLHGATESFDIMAALNFSSWYGSMKNKTFDALPKEMQAKLFNFDIDKKDWNLLRKYAVDDNGLLTINGVTNIPTSKLSNIDDLSMKIAMLFHTAVDTAVVKPSSRTEMTSASFFGLTEIGKTGTFGRELSNMFFSLKAHPLAFGQKHLMHMVHNMTPMEQTGYVARMLGSLTAAGYTIVLISEAYDVWSGKQKKFSSPNNWGTLQKSLVYGGATALAPDIIDILTYNKASNLFGVVPSKVYSVGESVVKSATKTFERGELSTGDVISEIVEQLPFDLPGRDIFVDNFNDEMMKILDYNTWHERREKEKYYFRKKNKEMRQKIIK